MDTRVDAHDMQAIATIEASGDGAAQQPLLGATEGKARAVQVVAGGLLVAACGSLWHYVGAILHPNALTYSHAFFMEDILPTYNAAHAILSGHGADMYDPAVVHGYTYSPVFALLFVPLALLPWSVAQVVWYVLCQLWLWLAIGALARVFSLVLPTEFQRWRVWTIPVVPTLAAVWLGLPPSVQASLDFGQVDYLILALLAIGVVHLLRGRDALGGVFICVAALLKITPFGLIALLLLGKRWRALAGSGITLGVCVLATAAIPAVGFGAWAAMRGGVDANLVFIFGQYANESLGSLAAHVLALVHRHVGAHLGEYLGVGLAGLLYVPVAALAWTRKAAPAARFGAIIACGIGPVLLASPLNWDHSFAAACVPTAFLLGAVATEYMATGLLRARHIIGALAASILAAWPSTAALSVDQGAGVARLLGGIALIAARPVALVAITCLLLWYLARTAMTPGALFVLRRRGAAARAQVLPVR